jgi:hypothetical protein
MLGKLAAAAITIVVGCEGWKWWGRHKSQYSLISGHTYTLVLDFTKAPVSPAAQSDIQAALDKVDPGTFDVINVSTDVANKRQTILVSVSASVMLTGDQLVAAVALPAGFGTVTFGSLTDSAATSLATTTTS